MSGIASTKSYRRPSRMSRRHSSFSLVNPELLQRLAVVGPALLFSVIAHEIAHGYAALRQGDETAKQAGRLTWNPIPHIDPIFTLLVPAMMLMAGGGILGGAKPVPVDPRNYRNIVRGDIIVSLAGVATNLVISLACVLLVVVFGFAGQALPGAAGVFGYLQALAFYAVFLNWILIIFNLLPIPPLDGSHVMKYLLPRPLAIPYVQYGARFGFLVLIALVFFLPGALSMIMTPAYEIADALRWPTRGFWLDEARQWLR